MGGVGVGVGVEPRMQVVELVELVEQQQSAQAVEEELPRAQRELVATLAVQELVLLVRVDRLDQALHQEVGLEA